MERRSDWTGINQVKTTRNNLFESSKLWRGAFEVYMSSATSSSGRANNKTRISAHRTISTLRPDKKWCQMVFNYTASLSLGYLIGVEVVKEMSCACQKWDISMCSIILCNFTEESTTFLDNETRKKFFF